jgi:hypothetical protein
MQQRLLPVGTILLVILWTARCVAGQPLISPEVHKQLDMPEGQLDIGIAALTIAKEVYLELDIPAYSRKLDTLADKVRWLAKGTRDPEQRIRVLNTALFRYEGFHYDRAPFSRSKQTYYFLNGILDTKQGICITMPLLYIAVAQRLGYPIYPVAAPDHMFVRYVDTSFKQQNIETTSGGKYFSDQEYIEDFFVSAKALKSGGYMRTMTYREFLAHILVARWPTSRRPSRSIRDSPISICPSGKATSRRARSSGGLSSRRIVTRACDTRRRRRSWGSWVWRTLRQEGRQGGNEHGATSFGSIVSWARPVRASDVLRQGDGRHI